MNFLHTKGKLCYNMSNLKKEGDIMTVEKNFREIFAKRLNYYMSINNKRQIDLVEDLGIPRATVSNWCNAKKMPEMVKIDTLAKYFNINRSDLLEEKKEKIETIAAHHDGEEWTQEELKAIEDFKAFIRSRRK